jgi:hypothetical protein
MKEDTDSWNAKSRFHCICNHRSTLVPDAYDALRLLAPYPRREKNASSALGNMVLQPAPE